MDPCEYTCHCRIATAWTCICGTPAGVAHFCTGAPKDEEAMWPKAATAQEVLEDNLRAKNVMELLAWVGREPENFCRAAVDLAEEVRRLQQEGR